MLQTQPCLPSALCVGRQPPATLGYCRFIKWTQETFQAGGHKAELLPLLERCTRELQSLPKYKGDIRYLRVWVQYVSTLCHKRHGVGARKTIWALGALCYNAWPINTLF